MHGRSLSLKQQLLLFVCISAVGVGGVSWFAGSGLMSLSRELKVIGEGTEMRLGQIYSMLENCSLIQSKVQVILGQRDPDVLEKQLAELEGLQNTTKKHIEACGEDCDAIARQFASLMVVDQKIIGMLLAGNSADAYAALASDAAPLFSSLQKELRGYSQNIATVIRQSNEDASTSAQHQVLITIAFSILASVVVIGLGLLVRHRLSMRLSESVRVLKTIGEGNFDQRLAESPQDELGLMGSVINGMANKIGGLLKSIEMKNKELMALNGSLELKVNERTKAVRTILDHVTFGLVICDSRLIIQEGYSNSCSHILGCEGSLDGKSLIELLRLDPRKGENFKCIYDQIFDSDFLLGDLSVDYLPTRFEIGKTTIGLTGSAVHDESGQSVGVLFCVADISNLAKAEDEIERNRSLIKMLSNRDSFRSFVREVKSGYERTYAEFAQFQPNEALIRRELHTLKGNIAMFGLSHIAREIHAVEDSQNIAKALVEPTENHFRAFLDEHRSLLGTEYGTTHDDSFVVPARLVNLAEQRARSVTDPNSLSDIFSEFFKLIRLKQARTILGPIDDSFKNLAERLGKTARLIVVGGETLVPAEASDAFKVLGHLLRNALDHGLEGPSERVGKPEVGTVTLNIEQHANDLIIKVSDDGKGLDRERILQKAIKSGLIESDRQDQISESEIYQLILQSGFSTADSVTDISGRGVGMDAVKSAIEGMGGTLVLNSAPNVGTTFVIKVPVGVSASVSHDPFQIAQPRVGKIA